MPKFFDNRRKFMAREVVSMGFGVCKEREMVERSQWKEISLRI